MDDLIKRCVDLDEWKHSWHNKFKCIEDYEKAKAVINEKMDERIRDLAILNDGLKKIDAIISRELAIIEEMALPEITTK